ncbi:hypothetical protein LPJ73_005949 [Coemansia sp. RSA 2703]|nr:hypothetical protein LPJ73_005949 [Coemansia sp. RSA 2703]KAJ2362817.1 hypothetical protein IW150_006905 [Coemansia sp. RSA 2607]KAJ2394859.1 hypothetical protein GGI05_001850 [Coemansia sp. RSA 2603]
METPAQPIPFSDAPKPKGILKRPSDSPEKTSHLRWDEDNIRITEAQKDAKMKVDEPKTPYIRYNPDLDADLQEMEDLKLASDMSSRSSSVMSSPKRAQVIAPSDWASDSEDESTRAEMTEAEKAKHERFEKMRKQHYHLEGKYVHGEVPNAVDSDASINSTNDDDKDGNSSQNKSARADMTEAEKAKHERFEKMRKQHYHLEGKYVHSDVAHIVDSDASINSTNDDDDDGNTSDEQLNGNSANNRMVSPRDVHVSRGFKATFGNDDSSSADFSTNVDDVNASNMEL